MNELNINQSLRIVNKRVLQMLDSSMVNNELFFRDIRTLVELIDFKLNKEEKGFNQ